MSLPSASGEAGEPLSVELLVAGAIGLLTACGIYLMLRGCTFPVVLGLMLLSYAVNLFIVAMGRLAIGVPPIVAARARGYADPLPQALVLTAIVIGLATTVFAIVLALVVSAATGGDQVDGDRAPAARRGWATMTHAAIVPVLVPSAVAALMILVGDRRLGLQRALGLASCVRAAAGRDRGGPPNLVRRDRGLPRRRLAGALRDRARRSIGSPRSCSRSPRSSRSRRSPPC